MVSPFSFAASRFKASKQLFFWSAFLEVGDVAGGIAVDALVVASRVRVKRKFGWASAEARTPRVKACD